MFYDDWMIEGVYDRMITSWGSPIFRILMALGGGGGVYLDVNKSKNIEYVRTYVYRSAAPWDYKSTNKFWGIKPI